VFGSAFTMVVHVAVSHHAMPAGAIWAWSMLSAPCRVWMQLSSTRRQRPLLPVLAVVVVVVMMLQELAVRCAVWCYACWLLRAKQSCTADYLAARRVQRMWPRNRECGCRYQGCC
jgi:hypothetical protein